MDQETITAGYDRVAPFYRALSPLFLITPRARRKGVAALALRPGDTVLEVGVGTGRNLRYLVDAVGPTGTVIGVDLSGGMLAQARKLVTRDGWSNVELIQADAATVEIPGELDAALFSLSYSAMPEAVREPGREPCLGGAPPRRPPRGDGPRPRPRPRLRPLLDPIAKVLVKLGPGHAYVACPGTTSPASARSPPTASTTSSTSAGSPSRRPPDLLLQRSIGSP